MNTCTHKPTQEVYIHVMGGGGGGGSCLVRGQRGRRPWGHLILSSQVEKGGGHLGLVWSGKEGGGGGGRPWACLILFGKGEKGGGETLWSSHLVGEGVEEREDGGHLILLNKGEKMFGVIISC